MGLLGHQPQEVVWILGWPQYLITGLRAFDKRSPGGTLWRLTIREGLSAAVEAEVDGVAAHLHRGGWCGRACSYCCSALLLKILKVGRQAKHSHGSDRTGRSPNQNSKLEITRATSKTPINTLNTSPTRARPSCSSSLSRHSTTPFLPLFTCLPIWSATRLTPQQHESKHARWPDP